MKKFLKLTVMTSAVVMGVASNLSQASAFSPGFDQPIHTFVDTGLGFQGLDVTADDNNYYSANYGITITNAFLYQDSRDVVDGVGIANGMISQVNLSQQTGTITFEKGTDFATIGYIAVNDSTYGAFSSSNQLLSIFVANSGDFGVHTFNSVAGEKISYITFSSLGGYAGISDLSYDYSAAPVPEPEEWAMMLLGLPLMGFVARRKKTA